MEAGQRIRVLSGPDAGRKGTVVGVYPASGPPKFDVKLDNGRNYNYTSNEIEPIDK